VPLRRGRFFSTDDTIAKLRFSTLTKEEIAKGDVAPPVIVNESFVRRFLGEREPIGTRFRVGRDRFEVVGVAGDMRRDGPERPAVAEYFSPYVGETSEIAVRTSADPLSLSASVRDTIRSIDKNAMVLSVTTLERRLGELSAPRTAQTWLLTAFASLALALAAIGIYGVVRYGVAQRRHEIAVRIALGARAGDVLRLIVGEGMIAPFAGAIIGLLGAVWLTRLLTHLLFEIDPTDPITFGAVAVVLVSAALVACWLPARRASRVDPLQALRCE
jgi:ABC-type antimicrobial peptide transport system permease subunit